MAGNVNDLAIGRLLEINRARKQETQDDPFERAPLNVGMEMYIDTKIGFSPNKPMKSLLVGYMKNQYLIVTTPRIEGLSAKYADSSNIVVRYISRRSVYSFRTQALRTMGPPFHLTFLQFPEKVEETALRASPRLQVGIPFGRSDVEPNREFIMNLSSTGALLKMAQQVPMDSTLIVSFHLPNGQLLENVPCMVKRVEASGNGVLAGVMFDPKYPRIRLISDYVRFVLEGISSETSLVR